MQLIKDIQNEIDDIKYGNLQIYFCGFCMLLSIFLHFDFTIFWSFLDNTTILGMPFVKLAISSLNATILGLIGSQLNSEGESYYKFVNDNFNSKSTAFKVKIIGMSAVGVILQNILPNFIRNNATYPAIQTIGAVILLGYILIHLEITDWKLENELPIILGSFLLVSTPLII